MRKDCGGGACLTTRDTIVIGIDNTPGRIWELTPTADASIGDGGGGDAYLTMVATELKPTVDAMLRTAPGPADTAIMGSSLGGLISAYAGVARSGVFGLVPDLPRPRLRRGYDLPPRRAGRRHPLRGVLGPALPRRRAVPDGPAAVTTRRSRR